MQKKWFDLVDDTYLKENTDNVSMYLLKRENDMQKLEIKYNEIYNRKKSQNQDTVELRKFNIELQSQERV